MIVASRTAETLRAQFDEHSLFQNRQTPQADRIIVAVKLKGLLPAPRADRIEARALDRNNDLSLFQFGIQKAGFGNVQRKLYHWRHRSIPLYLGIYSTSACHNFNRAPRPQDIGAFPAIPRET